VGVGEYKKKGRPSNLELRIKRLEEVDARAEEEKDERKVFILFGEDPEAADEPLERDR
jgi:hypothetical protein